MTERAQRDELERLQVETKALETELALEHAPAFVAAKAEHRAALVKEEAALKALSSTLATAETAQRELAERVLGLQGELHAAQQRSVNASTPFLIFPAVLGVFAAWPTDLTRAPLGFSVAAVLGFLFGPRVLGFFRPRSASAVQSTLLDAFSGAMSGLRFLTACVLAVGVGISGLGTVLDYLWPPGDGPSQTDLVIATLSTLSTMLALRPNPPAALDLRRVLERGMGVLGLGVSGAIAAHWAWDLLGGAIGSRPLPIEPPLTSAASLLPFLCNAALLAARWGPWRKSRWRAPVSGAALLGGLVTAIWSQVGSTHLDTTLLSAVGLQLGLVGGVLGADAAHSPRSPWPRRVLALIGFFIAAFNMAPRLW